MILCVIYIVLCCTGSRVNIKETGTIGKSEDSRELIEMIKYSEEDICLILNGTKKTVPDDPALLQYIKDQVVAPVTQPLHLSQPLHTGQVYLVL